MSEKVYGICGTNKCRREVVAKEEYDSHNKELIEDLNKVVSKSRVQIMSVTSHGFLASNNRPGIYYFTENNMFGAEGCSYTVEIMIYDRKNMTYEPVPIIYSEARMQEENNVTCAHYRITKDDVQTELYVSISTAAYNLLKSNSGKELIVICRWYE